MNKNKISKLILLSGLVILGASTFKVYAEYYIVHAVPCVPIVEPCCHCHHHRVHHKRHKHRCHKVHRCGCRRSDYHIDIYYIYPQQSSPAPCMPPPCPCHFQEPYVSNYGWAPTTYNTYYPMYARSSDFNGDLRTGDDVGAELNIN